MYVNEDTRTREGYSNVGDFRIRYTINQKTGEPVNNIRASIEKNDKNVGYATLNSDGTVYVSFDKENDTTLATKKEIVDVMFDDAKQVFSDNSNQ